MPSSHTMSVAASDHDVAAAIANHGSDLVVQQLLPHNGMVLKVYVIADTVWVRSRMSLPADLSRPGPRPHRRPPQPNPACRRQAANKPSPCLLRSCLSCHPASCARVFRVTLSPGLVSFVSPCLPRSNPFISDVPLTEVNSQTVSKERDTDPRNVLDAFAAHADHARLKRISRALGTSLVLRSASYLRRFAGS